MRYCLANGRNASRRRGQLLPGCAIALHIGERISKDRLLPNVAMGDDDLHDNGNIEASAISCGLTRKHWRWENGSQAGRMTWKITWRQIMRPREKLDPWLLHTGRDGSAD